MKVKTYIKNIYPRKIYHHVKKTKKISDQIVKLFNEKAYMNSEIKPFTSDEIISIKYGSYLHDIGKTIDKRKHDKIGEKLFKKYIWYDIKPDLKSDGFKKDDRKIIKKNISCAIACHKKWKNSEQDIGSIYVSMIVYAADKIAHISKDYSWDSYWNASRKIHKRIQKIQKYYGRTSRFDLLCSCIIKTLSNECPF